MMRKETNRSSSKSKMTLCLILTLLVVGLAMKVSAQDSRDPKRGIQAGSIYSVGNFEAVNVSNGNVVVNFPLASLPAGRGTSPGFTLTLQYNSKLWNSKQTNYSNHLLQGNSDMNPENDYFYWKNTLEQNDPSGWKLLTGYRLIEKNRLTLDSPDPCNGGDIIEYNARWKLEMEFPDGSVKQFIPVYGSGAQTKDGFYNINSNGVGESYSIQTAPQNGRCYVAGNSVQLITTGMHYMTTDGSRLRLFIPYVPNYQPNITPQNWKLYSSDGTMVETNPPDDSTVQQRVTDRNGNKIEHKGNVITDQLGRSITIDGNGVTYKGVNGVNITTQLVWGTRWVYRRYQTIGNDQNNIPTGTDRFDYVNEQIQVLEQIVLPSQAGGQTYTFDYYADTSQGSGTNYTNGWGELKSVTYPSGAKNTYSYTDLPSDDHEAKDIVEQKVYQKDLTFDELYDGITTPRTETTNYTTYDYLASVTNPNGATSSEYLISYPIGPQWDSGLTYRSNNPDGSFTERMWSQNLPNYTNNTYPYPYMIPANSNAYVKTEFTTISDSNLQPSLTAIKDYTYDKNGNILEVREYDFVPYSSVPRSGTGINSKPTGLPSNINSYLKRKTINTYYNQAPNAESTASSSYTFENPNSPKLKNVLKSTEIQNASGTPVSRSEFIYDDPNNKGNLIETRVWDSTKQATLGSPDGNGFKLNTSNSIKSTVAYDTYGNPTLMTDAKGVQTQITYGAVNGFTGLYPTETKTAYGLAEQRTATAQYDFYTGLVTSTTDVDNNVTSSTEYDALGRPLKVKAAVGTAHEIWTQTEYNDTLRRVVVKSDIAVKGDGKKVGIQHFDELGRVRLTRTLEDVANEDPYNEQDGIKVQTRYKYDNGANPTTSNGVYSLTSNPYRANYSTNATNETTMGWTVSYTDKTGRYSESENFAGSTLPAPWGSNSNSTGKSFTEIDANATTVTDAANKKRRSITNALGQLTRVDEPDNSGNLGTISSPVQPTSYKYNTLGKMIEVTQGVQQRHFLYDSLGRMLRVRQPEQEVNTNLNMSNLETTNTQWTAGFTYDNNGNVLTATDAENKTITSTYDNLNRPVSQNYSDGITPNVTYTYDDSTVPYSKGKLTEVSNSISTTQTTEFDIMGRPKVNQQITDGTTYQMKYVYNLSGQLVEEEYPSGRKVKNDFDENGDISRIYGNSTPTAVEKTYANGFAYTADGRIQRLKVGNGRWESAKFNSNMQVTELALGTSDGNGSMWKQTYEYGELNTNGTVDTTKNTGNVAKQTLSFNGLANPFVQTFKYDSLDRITEAKEMNNNQQTWMQTYGYDKYGNRTAFAQNILGQNLAINNITLPTVNTNTNRFNTGQGYEYDKIGNLKKDVTANQSRDIKFNGDNKQIEIKDTNTGIKIGEYFYDGSGKRVKKRVFDGNNQPIEDVIFVYSGDKLVAEYSTQPAPTNPTTKYVVTDTLGSVRAITNHLGEVISRRDFMPFGEELEADTTYRKSNLKYNADDVRQKFTGYQKDEESGLDFAEARMYNNAHARFTAVDPLLASGKSANPQTFNRYVYVMNNPIAYTDPDGLQAGNKPKDKKQIPNIKVSVVSVPKANVYRNQRVDGGSEGTKYFTGAGSIITVRITDLDNKPIKGAKVEESNVPTDGRPGNIVENQGTNITNENGEFDDIVGVGVISDKPRDDAPSKEDLKESVNSNQIERPDEQTLTITTPDGGVHKAVYRRNVSNVVEKDGKKELNQDKNSNGINLTVTTTEPVVTNEKEPPKIFLKPIN